MEKIKKKENASLRGWLWSELLERNEVNSSILNLFCEVTENTLYDGQFKSQRCSVLRRQSFGKRRLSVHSMKFLSHPPVWWQLLIRRSFSARQTGALPIKTQNTVMANCANIGDRFNWLRLLATSSVGQLPVSGLPCTIFLVTYREYRGLSLERVLLRYIWNQRTDDGNEVHVV